MRRRRLIASGAVALGALVSLPTASLAALPDATCPGPTNAGISGNTEAQTFTALHSGTLVRGEMFVAKTAGGDFQMHILNAGPLGPSGAPLATTTIPDSSVANIPSPGPTSPSAPVDGTFNPGVPVTAGQQYAIVVTRSSGGMWVTKDRQDAGCPGNEFTANSIAGPWTLSNPEYDYPFSTFVNPPNSFTVGKVKGAKVTLSLPGPGAVDVAGSKKNKASHTDVAAGGDLSLRIALTKRAKSQLRKKGKLKLAASITYTPTGGDASSQSAKLKLKSK